jgi:hypothetical protein
VAKDEALREHLLELLRGGSAHITFDDVIKDFPVAAINGRVAPIPYTPWQVLEHMRIAQLDILEFCRDATAHVSPPWPEGYWPEPAAEADEAAWRASVAAFNDDYERVVRLVNDPATDLYARVPDGQGQTFLREVLLVADHNAYHLGVLATLKRLLTKQTE